MNRRHNRPCIRSLALATLCAALPLAGGATLRAQLVPNLKRAAAAQDPALQGLWTGTAEEQTEAGRVSFPVEMRFSGTSKELALQITGRGKVDAGQGQQVSFVVDASYRGTLRGRSLQMRSRKVETRLVEYDEVMVGAPQTLAAELVDGVLRGRVGSEEEGWTRFEARSAEAASADRPGDESEPGFAGSWEGDVQEPGPDGRPLRYRMKAEITEGAGGVEARLAADLQYPVGQGQTVPVEYRARFAGRSAGGDVLEMDSSSVQYRMVSENRSQEGGSQRIVAELEDGVLALTLFSDGNQPTEMRLQRIGAPPVRGGLRGRDATREHEEAMRRTRGGEGSEPGSEQGFPGERAPARAAASAGTGTLVLEPLQIRDPGLGNVVSHTLMVPQGWQFEGGPRWTANPDNFVNFTGSLRSPEGQEVAFSPTVSIVWKSMNGRPMVQPGPAGSGVVHHPAPQGYGEIAANVLLPQLRPGATDVQLVEAERLHDVEAQWREFMGDQLARLEQMAKQSSSNMAGTQSDMQILLVSERARLRYRENGQAWEEEFRSTTLAQLSAIRNEFMASESSTFNVYGVRSCRAPAGELESSLPTLVSLAGTLREAPAWSVAINDLRQQMLAAKARGRRMALESMRSTARATASTDLSDSAMASWRRRQDSIDRMHKAEIDTIHETHDFRHSDGSTWTFTNTYDRAFMNAGGQVVLTNDPSLNPGADPRFGGANWQQMERIDRFRR